MIEKAKPFLAIAVIAAAIAEVFGVNAHFVTLANAAICAVWILE